MRAKSWLRLFGLLCAAVFLLAGVFVWYVDPFFHYHAPRTESFFYPLDNERSMNDGILRNFDYDAILTGTSLAACFKTSELDELFDVRAVKIPASGASYFEINRLIGTGLDTHPDTKLVVRSIDRHLLLYGTEELRNDLGKYPDYLYDRNPFNDCKYLFNADVLFGRCLGMALDSLRPGFEPGVTSFDDYSNTMAEYKGAFGLPHIEEMFHFDFDAVGEPIHLGEFDRQQVTRKIQQNVIAIAEAHPDVTFYCFFPPVSLGYWRDRIAFGDIYAQIEAEQLATELMLQCPNIRLFDFTGRTDIISDVNQYRDLMHYGEWINSLMLKWMREDRYRLTEENYRDFFADRLAYYLAADYTSLLTAVRWNCDYYAAALLNEELTGVPPRVLGDDALQNGRLSLPDAGTYSYLCFEGRCAQPGDTLTIAVCDESGPCLSVTEEPFQTDGWQCFAVDLRAVSGAAEVLIDGGTGFRGFTLY